MIHPSQVHLSHYHNASIWNVAGRFCSLWLALEVIYLSASKQLGSHGTIEDTLQISDYLGI